LTVVIDSSAIIAALKGEPGGELFETYLSDALISTVSVAEVHGFAMRSALSSTIIDAFLTYQGIEIAPLSLDQAVQAGKLVSITQIAGLSLGDRCCLALAIDRNASVLTADRPWLQFADKLGIDIVTIR
jgi:ribonuclease VapC